MNAKHILWLLLILAVAGFIVIMLKAISPQAQVIVQQEQALVASPEANETELWLLTASQDLALGHQATLADFSWTPTPESQAQKMLAYIEKGSIDTDSLKGSLLRSELKQGQIVMPGMLLKHGDPGYLAMTLAPGMRAVSLEIKKDAAQAALLAPGDEVDVVMTMKEITGQIGNVEVGTMRATVVASKSRVLAVNRTLQASETAAHTDVEEDESLDDQHKEEIIVTLEMSPQQGVKTALANQMGKDMRLILRHPGDHDSFNAQYRSTDIVKDMRTLQSATSTLLMRGDDTQFVGGY